MSTKKKTYEEVKKIVENRGFKLLSDSYINSLGKIKILCPSHGESEITFKWFQKGTGCFKCGQEVKVAHRRHSISFIKDKIEKMGYKLVSTEYKNTKLPITINCPKHGNFISNYGTLNGGHGCRACGYETVGRKTRTNIDEIKTKAESLGYELITTSYDSHDQDIILKCSKHGEFTKTIYALNIEQGCQKCGYESNANEKRHTKDYIKIIIDQAGYIWKDEIYVNSQIPLNLSCSKHGDFTIRLYDLKSGHKCRRCAAEFSKPQIEIFDIVKEICPDALLDTNKILYPKELDVYIPSKKIAIEYCGLYWHSENKKLPDYHVNKMNHCIKKGIQLITIFEDEWLERKEQIITTIKNKLGNAKREYARKCEIKEISKEECKIFNSKYHIQGYGNSIIHIGLFFKDKLIGTISGNEHHRGKKDKAIVLNRLCFGKIAVNGGSSKLFKAFINKAKSLGYSKIISWSDNRWSNGNVYNKLGFTLEAELDIDYSYCKAQKRMSKQSCQKKYLLQRGATGTTEREMAESLGYEKIWDCGKKRWVFNIL